MGWRFTVYNWIHFLSVCGHSPYLILQSPHLQPLSSVSSYAIKKLLLRLPIVRCVMILGLNRLYTHLMLSSLKQAFVFDTACLSFLSTVVYKGRVCINRDVLMCFPPEGNTAPLSLFPSIWHICHAAAFCSPTRCPHTEPDRSCTDRAEKLSTLNLLKQCHNALCKYHWNQKTTS